jgi:glutamate synthase domain-containing protein 3
VQWTDSAVGAALLARWDDAVGEFRMVMPRDYARVLKVMKDAESEGLDEAATLERVMEASRG